MKLALKITLFLTALWSFSLSARISVENPVVFATSAKQPTAVFMTLKNSGVQAVNLVMADSEIESRLELHGMQNGRMLTVSGIEIPARDSVQLKRGGLHLMLFDVATALPQGGEFPLTLYFDNGEILSVKALVVTH